MGEQSSRRRTIDWWVNAGQVSAAIGDQRGSVDADDPIRPDLALKRCGAAQISALAVVETPVGLAVAPSYSSCLRPSSPNFRHPLPRRS